MQIALSRFDPGRIQNVVAQFEQMPTAVLLIGLWTKHPASQQKSFAHIQLE
jgi:hypothetical protein